MTSKAVQDIEQAIGALTPHELQELYAWLDQHGPQPIDDRLQSGLSAGHFDKAIEQALADDKSGQSRPL
jgi:hypothetical protein